MTGIVPSRRYEPVPGYILCGATTSSGRTWLPAAFLSNWLNGNGSQIIPGMVVDKTILGASGGGELHFKAKTRLATVERLWTIMVRGTVPGGVVLIQAPAGTGTVVAVVTGIGRDSRMPILYREPVAAQASAREDISISIKPFNAAAGDIDIESLTCSELSRPLLEQDGVDFGVNTQTERPRERIYAGPVGSSTTGVVLGSYGDPRRSGIYHFSVPIDTPVSYSGAATSLLQLPVPVLARKLNSGATTATVYWSAYACVSAGTGTVSVSTSHSGVSDSVSVTSVSPTFVWSTPRAISIDCEDMTADDGRQAATWDDLTIQMACSGGSIKLAAVSVWDEAT